MKKIINDKEAIVKEMIRGIVLSNKELDYDPKYNFVYKKDININKVLLITGGGSGHEPFAAGYIGKGMLDCAVCGNIFASPSQIQVYKSIKKLEELHKKKQKEENKTLPINILLLILNYSGDILNFTNAMEMAKEEGININYIKIDDDIAVNNSLYTVGKRGVAGMVLLCKIIGAASEKLYDLEKLTNLGKNVISNIFSIGFALKSCTVPANGAPTFLLEKDEIEYGIGIHSEPGIKKEKLLSANELSVKMCNDILKNVDLKNDDEILILVNGFGGTPLMELYILNENIIKYLSDKCKIMDDMVGNYMTSIDMEGASLTIFKIYNNEVKEFLEDEVYTLGLKQKKINLEKIVPKSNDEKILNIDINEKIKNYENLLEKYKIKNDDNNLTLNNFYYLIFHMSKIIIQNEQKFCEMDSHAGDGDFGISISSGFKQIIINYDELMKNKNISDFLNNVSLLLFEYCGGASGPIWGSAFRGASKILKNIENVKIENFSNMLSESIIYIQNIGKKSFGKGAEVGDKTLIDALIPCYNAWKDYKGNSYGEIFKLGAKAAQDGAENTKNFAAKLGRAGNVGDRSLGFPDAGAYGLSEIFKSLSDLI